jgi:hypothetical protein
MTTFQWLLVLGFPPEVAATTAMPAVFASDDTVTSNDLLACPERRESPALASVLQPAAA